MLWTFATIGSPGALPSAPVIDSSIRPSASHPKGDATSVVSRGFTLGHGIRLSERVAADSAQRKARKAACSSASSIRPATCHGVSSRNGPAPIEPVTMTVALIAGGAKLVLAAVWVIALLTIGRVRARGR